MKRSPNDLDDRLRSLCGSFIFAAFAPEAEPSEASPRVLGHRPHPAPPKALPAGLLSGGLQADGCLPTNIGSRNHAFSNALRSPSGSDCQRLPLGSPHLLQLR